MLSVERLRTIPLFADLDEEELAHLAPHLHHRRARIGQLLTRQGESGDAFFVLDEGILRVRYVDAKNVERVLGYLNAPAFFGETSLLTGMHRDVTIDVFSDEAQLNVLPRTEFDDLLLQYPHIKAHLNLRRDIKDKLAQRLFPWLSEGEIVLVNTRRHWYAMAARLWLPLVAAIVMFVAGLVVLRFNPLGTGTIASVGLLILCAVWTLGWGIWVLLDWSNDHYIVTNKRVIHIEKVVFLFEEREEALIEQITNVAEQGNGLAARLFGFTDLQVETAGRRVDVNFTFAPRAKRVRQQVFEQINRVRDRVAFEKRERVRTGIRDELWNRLAPQLAGGGSEGATAGETAAQAAPVQRERAFRRVRYSGIGERLHQWFGLEVEGPHQVTWRKHWFVLFRRIDEPVFGILLLLMIAFLHLSGIVPVRVFGPAILSLPVKVGVGAAWMLIFMGALAWAWYRYADWSNDIYRVTDDRVIDIEKSPFGLRTRSIETTLDRVQDVSYVRQGIVANMFDYGNVIIETAGAGRFVFFGIRDPRGAVQEIFRRRDAHRASQLNDQVVQDRREFLDWFMEYHRFLQEQGEVAPPRPRTAATPESPGSTPAPPSEPRAAAGA